MNNGIQCLQHYINRRAHFLWVIKVRESKGMDKIFLIDNLTPLEMREVMERTFFLSDDALQQVVFNLSSRIDEIMDSISITDLTDIL
ncbi:hypothetical protein SAMN04488084_106142 [Pedobacter antarcticus]|nr:hypothetical protein SAMN04488084_106142 [Pedobacter antarcticus]